MKVLSKRLLLIAAAGFVLCGCRSQSATDGRTVDSGTTFAADALAPYVERGELAGAISVFYRQGVQETCCIGYADVKAGRRITMDDVFMQCSQTKGFCGVTIARLIEEGRLGLDDPVSKYLPEFKTLWVDQGETNGVRRLVRAKNVLTVRMVMNHTGGFPFEISAKSGGIRGGGWTGGAPIRQVAAIAAASPLLFEPGEKVQYSNTGIDIGAAVIEAITGRHWEDYLRETILDPLGMKDTTFWPTDEQLSRMIESYTLAPGKKAAYLYEHTMSQRPFNARSRIFASAGAGLWTTANDQLKFYKMLMNLGRGENGARILKEETVLKYLAVSSRPEGMGGYSLGLCAPEPSRRPEWTWICHGGAWGTNCYLDWKKKELKLFVSQFEGECPWLNEKAMERAEKAFFEVELDNSAVRAYTGRTN